LKAAALAADQLGVERQAGLRILVVDADAHARELCAAWLAASSLGSHVIEARSLAEARARTESERPDCVVLAESLPDGDAPALLSELADARGGLPWPVIVLGERGDPERAVAAIQAGAQDYAVRDRLTGEALARSVLNAIEKVGLRRALEREREAAAEARNRELEMKEELLSHVSHELRTPLTAIHQFVSIVLDEAAGELNSRQKEFLAIAYRNALQLRDMIGDLMEVSRGGAGRLSVTPVVMPLAPAIEAALDSLRGSAHERRIAFQIQMDEIPNVLADHLRVRQIVANLVGNALKFSPPGSWVRVHAAPCPDDRASVRISVEDQGCGIPKEEHARIFERMYQAPAQAYATRRGLGLGLYICRELVVGHHGRIWVESEVGRGSTFHFTLPAYRLARVLAPLFDADETASRHVHLLVLDVKIGAGGCPDPQALLAQLQVELEAHVHRNRDVVIPCVDRRSDPSRRDLERCFVVAQVDAAAVRAMATRLARALRRSEAVRGAGVELALRFHGLVLPSCDGVERERWLDALAAEVQDHIDAELRDLEAGR
jgi:signal transduction histidine kinase